MDYPRKDHVLIISETKRHLTSRAQPYQPRRALHKGDFLKTATILGRSAFALTSPLRRGLGDKGSATALWLLLRSLPGTLLIAIRTLSGKEAQSYQREAL